MQARGRPVEQQVDGEGGLGILVAAQEHPVVAQHRLTPDTRAVELSLPRGDGVRLAVDEHAVADLLGQAQQRALIEFAVPGVGGAVEPRLLRRLLGKMLRRGAPRPVGRLRAAREPQVAAEVVSGAVLLLDEGELLRAVDAAAEAALDVIAVRLLPLVRAQAGAQGVRRLDHAALPGVGGAADGEIVRADDLRREELREKRRPALVKVQAQGRLFMDGAVELQVRPEGIADGPLQLVGAERAGAGEGAGELLLPRVQRRRTLAEHALPAGGLERIDQLVLVHPLLP